ncbi:hypothetical protein BAUCODRAFT_39150 [Baudoinia panamericana UAMH 10762]|uniref:Uncharacterized protein n=1 Tax=Baudoinia panamericana (strain UAMH 10762) TaxID=717646 RepID=M2LDG7_BAUPA|nr:uncharacterized protein BAUCODRAFT_39150 [Baudoinia panamericana UAMH 10762]EMC92002.1 hypothetical protein BAUCODRAFT_39150 [Baudoinia panamericana UAMH 10762]
MTDFEKSVKTAQDSPPPYSSTTSEGVSNQHAAPGLTFDAIQQHIVAEKHSNYLWSNDDRSWTVTLDADGVEKAYTISAIEMEAFTSITMSNGTRHDIAVAEFAHKDTDFAVKFEVDERLAPQPGSWISISCEHSGDLFTPESFHWQHKNRRLAWKRTRDPSLGASWFGGEDYKLEDESRIGQPAPSRSRSHRIARRNMGERYVIASGDALAVCLHYKHIKTFSDQAGTSHRLRFHIDWPEEFGVDVEAGAILVLIASFFRSQRKRYEKSRPRVKEGLEESDLR